MCYRKVMDLLIIKGLPQEIALPIAIEWKYSAVTWKKRFNKKRLLIVD
jgi:hypothetical protein